MPSWHIPFIIFCWLLQPDHPFAFATLVYCTKAPNPARPGLQKDQNLFMCSTSEFTLAFTSIKDWERNCDVDSSVDLQEYSSIDKCPDALVTCTCMGVDLYGAAGFWVVRSMDGLRQKQKFKVHWGSCGHLKESHRCWSCGKCILKYLYGFCKSPRTYGLCNLLISNQAHNHQHQWFPWTVVQR